MIDPTSLLILLFSVVSLQRLSELLLAKRNLRWSIQHGAIEFGRQHYPLFFILHIAWMIAWIAESLNSGPSLSTYWLVYLMLFLGAEGLRFWAITSLGHYWNTRVLVIPGHLLRRSGPYRWLRHPNYIAVAIELFSLPMIFGAVNAAFFASMLNALLLLCIRLPCEERALNKLRKCADE